MEANVTWWVDGPGRDAGDVDPAVRDLVRQMQRRAFEVTADWDDIQQRELDPPALERLADIRVLTLAFLGGLDPDAIHDAAQRVADGIPDCAASSGQALPTYRRWSAATTSSHCYGTG